MTKANVHKPFRSYASLSLLVIRASDFGFSSQGGFPPFDDRAVLSVDAGWAN
jgi:hypothetical protein